jgi:hypothetical protein
MPVAVAAALVSSSLPASGDAMSAYHSHLPKRRMYSVLMVWVSTQ